MSSALGTDGYSPNGERIMRRRLPSEVVISRSSRRPTWTKSLSARSIPISSHVSRRAVYRGDSSAGSCLPPGKATWLLQREPELELDALGARRINRSSGTVPGCWTHSAVSYVTLFTRTEPQEVVKGKANTKLVGRDDGTDIVLRNAAFEHKFGGGLHAHDKSDGRAAGLGRW
jgi:hypothetical protein